MPLTYRDRGTSGTQLSVLCHEVPVASIRKEVFGQAERWRWSFSLGNAAPANFKHGGHADTCEEAKAAVEQNWQAWLTAAGLTAP